MNVARSHGFHAHTAHINQNVGAGYGTILQECISCSSWYACHSDFEIYFIVLGCVRLFSEMYNLCTIFVSDELNIMSWKEAVLVFLRHCPCNFMGTLACSWRNLEYWSFWARIPNLGHHWTEPGIKTSMV
jgi:hypothetical protein